MLLDRGYSDAEAIAHKTHTATAVAQPLSYRLGQWVQDPMGSVIAASAATIGAFGFVLFGTWFISLTLS